LAKKNYNTTQVKNAITYLKNNTIGKKFNGALVIVQNDLPDFIKHLFWLTRTNTVGGYIHFLNEEQNIIGHICQYGNLHLDSMHKKNNMLLKIFFEESKFRQQTIFDCS
jgi:hypothetical protein